MTRHIASKGAVRSHFEPGKWLLLWNKYTMFETRKKLRQAEEYIPLQL